MPQITSLPGYQATRSELSRLAYEHMFDNLTQNVQYRRAQQQRKASQAQDMELKMAAGLIPKANLEVSDEGIKFDNDAARNAYYGQISRMYGKDDMSRDGHTNISLDENSIKNNDKRFAQGVAEAEQAAKGDEQTQRIANYTESRFKAAQNMNDQHGAMSPEQGLNIASNYVMAKQPGYAESKQAALNQALGGAAWMQNQQNAINPLQPNSAASNANAQSQTAIAPPPAGQTPPSGKTPPKSSKEKTTNTTTVGTKDASGVGFSKTDYDQIEANYERPGFEYSQDDYAKTTTDVQSGRLDEIRTSMNNLLGLSALENYNNQLLRTNDMNQTAPLNNTFSGALAQRAADLKRWEEASTKDGTTEGYTKIGERKFKVNDTKMGVKVTAKDALSSHINVSNDTKVTGGSTHLSTGGNNAAPGKIFATNANGSTAQLAIDPTTQTLTANTSGLAFMTTGTTGQMSDQQLQRHINDKVNARNAAPLKPGKYNVQAQGNQIRITTPSGKVIVLQKNPNMKRAGAMPPGVLHGWEASANAGVDTEELQYFLGLDANQKSQ